MFTRTCSRVHSAKWGCTVGYVFVLGGGGAIGAYQAGALQTLAEAGIAPSALVGCSVGALNAAFFGANPSPERAKALIHFWQAEATRAVLSPSLLDRFRGAPAVLRRGDALLDQRPLRALLERSLEAHDLSELAVPLTVTTTCLDCSEAVHHTAGPLADILIASCSLPGLLSPVRLADGHQHVDGGVVCGVPVQAALDAARADDVVLVLDAGLAPVTGLPGRCAAGPDPHERLRAADPPGAAVHRSDRTGLGPRARRGASLLHRRPRRRQPRCRSRCPARPARPRPAAPRRRLVGRTPAQDADRAARLQPHRRPDGRRTPGHRGLARGWEPQRWASCWWYWCTTA